MKLTSTLFMKWLFAASVLLLSTVQLTAQDSCTFTLRIYDRFGDSWDDSQVFLKFGNNAERGYTHDGTSINSADSIRLFQIRVKPGDSIIIRYVAMGTYQNEIKYALFNNAGDLIFSDGLTPRTGIVFRGVVKCVNCGSAVNARISAIRSANATLTWQPTLRGNQPTYLVEWDTAGFQYGRGRNRFRTTDTFGILTNLNETTNYAAYIQTLCTNNDSSGVVGPLNFKTDTATNVGIINILRPLSSCNLGIDSIRFLMKNFAGAPQQLIPFKASINGQLLNIPFPADGLYTGVLSKDSTATITFKTPYDFSTPGEYNIAVWTELSGDKNKANDTFRMTIVRPRLVNQFPYIQNFEAGKDTWSVLDTTPTRNSTWQYGTPNYRYIQGAASGVSCWTTGKDTAYNNNEFGYLLSPCFDFSQLGTDPKISFDINVYSEKLGTTTYDGAWLEGSTDGGQTWRVMGGRGTGINWYQDTINTIRRPVWAGTTKAGWYLAQNTLTGMAGRANCRLRFGFRSDGSGNTTYDGVAIDNIVIGSTPTVDLAADSVTYSYVNYMNNCQIVMRIANLGSTPQSNFSVGYRVGNGAAVTENATGLTIQPNSVGIYRFNAKVPTPSTNQRLTVWVNAANDALRVNDSLPSGLLIPAAVKAKTLYDFNSTTNPVPPHWTAVRAAIGRSGHGNASGNGYIFANIYTDTAIFIDPIFGNDTIITPGARGMQATAGKFGPIRTDDTLRYDYRFVNESSPYAGYDLVNKDTLKVMIAADCDTVYTLVDTIYKSNHIIANTYRTRTIPLARFAGQIIKVRFQVVSAIDSFIGYYIDLDNLNILSCPQTFGHKVTITDATFGLPNGKIVLSSPTAGASPYTFLWSNGLSRDSIVNLAPGDYTVTITDAKGCTETRVLTVKRSTVSTNDPTSAISRLTLAPNPTSGSATLSLDMSRPVDTRVQVFNPMGQLLYQTGAKASEQQTFDLDMSSRPAGVYLIRVTAENRSHIVRLVKQ
ncbi:MAG: T9SS type A sorting domain-containing protein [Saprospiraceae bacterium]|nr:T9SS type A sorting domain-containing protein [Saprospiraceae bacterium]